MTLRFFGDSNAAGKRAVPASWYLDGPYEVENYAENGAGLDEVVAQVQNVIFAPGDVAIINGGINDLANGKSPQWVGDRFADAVAAVPAEIEVIRLPIYPYKPLQVEIKAANTLIGGLSGLYDELSNGGDLEHEYDSLDGLHLSPTGQREVAENVDWVVSDVAQWGFADAVSLDVTDADCLDRRWRTFHRPIPIADGAAYKTGYAGALASWTPPGDFTIDASFELSRSIHSFFSVVVNATADEWVQIGINFNGDHKFRVAHWKKAVHSRDLVPPFDVDMGVPLAELGSDSFVECDTRVTRLNGRVYVFSGGNLVADCELPAGLVGDAVGFWMRDCRLSEFNAGSAKVEAVG